MKNRLLSIFANNVCNLSNQLRGFEHVKGVILETRPFEAEQDLVTPTLKKRRDRLLKHYQVDWVCTLLLLVNFLKRIIVRVIDMIVQAKIDELYANLDERRKKG